MTKTGKLQPACLTVSHCAIKRSRMCKQSTHTMPKEESWLSKMCRL